jgi:tetratricopeptide (TPR) repeat protein
MQKAAFIEYLEEYPVGTFSDSSGLAELGSRYPYFYIAHVFKSIQTNGVDEHLFVNALRRASLLSPNRALLKNLVERKLRAVEPIAAVLKPANSAPIETENTESAIPIEYNTEPAVLEQISAYPELTLKQDSQSVEKEEHPIEQPRGTMRFSGWLKQFNHPKSLESIDNTVKQQEQDREVLIRKFIETDPQIGKAQRASFYSAAEMARKSTEERDDIVSETLAEVYAQQGDIARSIRIYQKLCLLYPEKSSYFATLIKNLTSTT